MDEINRKILNTLQKSFPVSDEPFKEVAKKIGVCQELVIERVRSMREDGTLTRFGPMFDAKELGGSFSLCAMSVPENEYYKIAELVNAHPEIAHNYKRDHELNMWFVLATETPDGILDCIQRIEKQTGCRVLNLPKLQEFFVGLYLEV